MQMRWDKTEPSGIVDSVLAGTPTGVPPKQLLMQIALADTPPPKSPCPIAGRDELHDLPAHVPAGRRQMHVLANRPDRERVRRCLHLRDRGVQLTAM